MRPLEDIKADIEYANAQWENEDARRVLREDVPDLVSEVERLRAAAQRAHDWLDDWAPELRHDSYVQADEIRAQLFDALAAPEPTPPTGEAA